jgi:hypothetical protein
MMRLSNTNTSCAEAPAGLAEFAGSVVESEGSGREFWLGHWKVRARPISHGGLLSRNFRGFHSLTNL